MSVGESNSVFKYTEIVINLESINEVLELLSC